MTAGQRRVLALRQLLRDASAQACEPSEQAQLPDEDESSVDRDESAESDQLLNPDEAVEACEQVDQDDQDESDQPTELDDQRHDQLVDAHQLNGHDPAPDGRADEVGPRPPAADGQGVQLTLVMRTPQSLAAGGPVPLVAGVDTVLGLPGALPGRYGPSPSTTLPVEAVRRLGCGGHLAAILLDAHGRHIGASGGHRHATERERRALLARWGGTCAIDGCGRPGVVPHHAEPWWLTHRTRLEDLVPYCDGCHHDLHEGGKTLKLRNGRWVGPSGWTDPPAGSLDLA